MEGSGGRRESTSSYLLKKIATLIVSGIQRIEVSYI